MGDHVAVTAANPSIACAMVVADELTRNGVREVIVAPGSRSTALAIAVHDNDALNVHVHPDERSAGFVALGIARQTGRPAAVITTSGSAVANLHPAVVEADSGQVPLLLLTADRPPELRHTGASQTIDQAGLFGNATRWAVDIAVAENRVDAVAMWRSTLCRALAAASGVHGSPGPVQVNIGFREPTVPVTDDGRSPPESFDQPVDGRSGGRPWISVTSGRCLPDAEREAAARTLVQHARGIIVVGQLAASVAEAQRSAVAIVELAEVLQWPVLAEPGPVRAHPADQVTIGFGHHLAASRALMADHRPTFVLRVGRIGVSPAVEAFLQSESLANVEQLLVDPYASWHDPNRQLTGVLAGDVAATCQRLAQDIAIMPERRPEQGWLQWWKTVDSRIEAALGELVDDGDLTEPAVARTCFRVLESGDVVVAGSSMPIRDIDRYTPAGTGVDLVANRGASGIDGTVSTALGVALTRKRGRVVALAGDLTMLHDMNGWLLSPADRAVPDITFVVVDNNGGGIFSFLPQAKFVGAFERLFGTPHGRSFKRYAEFHDLAYHPATTVAELEAALQRTRTGQNLIHVQTERTANVVWHRELDQAVAVVIGELASG
ncbi:MAG: 2-succinyl-5-enolpyruvyl-6-hydroxy-3-cyclohexene-1-carboxylic-acid synthase [Nitriliruptoraceae bacterium]